MRMWRGLKTGPKTSPGEDTGRHEQCSPARETREGESGKGEARVFYVTSFLFLLHCLARGIGVVLC